MRRRWWTPAAHSINLYSVFTLVALSHRVLSDVSGPSATRRLWVPRHAVVRGAGVVVPLLWQYSSHAPSPRSSVQYRSTACDENVTLVLDSTSLPCTLACCPFTSGSRCSVSILTQWAVLLRMGDWLRAECDRRCGWFGSKRALISR